MKNEQNSQPTDIFADNIICNHRRGWR